MPNQSKMKDPRFWKKWEHAKAIGSVVTTRHQKKILVATNNAQGVEISYCDKQLRLIGIFSQEDMSEMILDHNEIATLLKTRRHKITGIYGQIIIYPNEVRVWFNPSEQGCDLICLERWIFVRYLKSAIGKY